MSTHKLANYSTIHDYDESLYEELNSNYNYQKELTQKLDDQFDIPFNQEIINEIVLWKVNRYVPSTGQNWLNKLNAFKDDLELDEEKLIAFLEEVLSSDVRGIRLAMASTFLRFRNPNVYQIIDERTYRVVMRRDRNLKGNLIQYEQTHELINLYIDYLEDLKMFCQEKKLNFKEADRILYQFDKEENKDFKRKKTDEVLFTKHQYINDSPIHPSSTKLILGTIHPHFTDAFDVDFFYGNRATLWIIFHGAFPEELKNPLDKKEIIKFLTNRKIAISDTILSCKRKNASAADSSLIEIELHHQLKETIKNSAITEIYFTSSFQKNNAFRLFYEGILGKKVTKEIKENKEVLLDTSIFGRPIRLIILLSPSGAANIAISKAVDYLNNKDKFTSKTPIKEYKIAWYKKKFN